MKKNFFAFISILFVVAFLISACATNSTPKSDTAWPTILSQQTGQLSQEPAGALPIVFDTFASAVEFVKNPNFSDYYNKWQGSYRAMVERLFVDGQLLIASHTSANKLNDSVTLYPEAEYEDVGIGFWFKYDDISYQVIVYRIKDGAEYTLDTETESIIAYYEKRLGVPQKYDYEYVNTNNLQMPKMMIHKIDLDEGRYSADCMVGDTHYIVIRTEADKAALLSFVDGLQIDSISLD